MKYFRGFYLTRDYESEGIRRRSPSVRPQFWVKVAKIYVKMANIFQKIKNGPIFLLILVDFDTQIY
jgi:hypothetical protein